MAPLDELFENIRFTLSINLHGVVRQVPDPAFYTKAVGNLLCACPEPYTLYPAVYYNMDVSQITHDLSFLLYGFPASGMLFFFQWQIECENDQNYGPIYDKIGQVKQRLLIQYET